MRSLSIREVPPRARGGHSAGSGYRNEKANKKYRRLRLLFGNFYSTALLNTNRERPATADTGRPNFPEPVKTSLHVSPFCLFNLLFFY